MSLCVIPKNAFTLRSILHQLLGMGTARDAATATRHVSSWSLALQEVRQGVRGITIHDFRDGILRETDREE
jgi:hypothetical protein